MRLLKTIPSLVVLLAIPCSMYAQDDMLDSVPRTREEFLQSAHRLINTINWLDNTPADQFVSERKMRMALVVDWVAKSPTVNVELNEKLMPFSKKNNQLMLVFIGGWVRYALQHDYSRDPVQCNLAGIRTAIKVYKMGVNIRKDKEMEKLITLDEQGQLEDWVRSQLGIQLG